jgi:hypothetical protein
MPKAKTALNAAATKPEATQTVHEDQGGWSEWLDDNGKRHRANGPAVEYPNGMKMYYCHGLLHRDGGPAIECPDGSVQWWRQGHQMTSAEAAAAEQTIALAKQNAMKIAFKL